MLEFYTYLWIRKDGTPYYVGKGHDDRAFTGRGHGVHCPQDRTRIMVQHWESEDKAFEMEIKLIRFFGRKDNGTGMLRNLTDGGDGRSGSIHSLETRQKISRSKKGFVPNTAAYRNRGSKISAGRLGIKCRPMKDPEGFRRKVAEARGRWTPEQKLAHSQKMKENANKRWRPQGAN